MTLKHTVGGIVLTCALLPVSVGFAAPASADEPPSVAISTWDMPDVSKEVVQRAVDDIRAAAGSVQLKFAFNDTKGNRDVTNLTNWSVCWQYPEADASVRSKADKVTTITLGVKRLNDKNCYQPN
ncbi:MAG: hypothetical protein AB1925_17780 [Actinomycetota bacterium]